MKIAFIIFDGMTTLDFIGAFDAVTRLKTMGVIENLSWDICALTETVSDPAGLKIIPTKIGEPLSGYDLLMVPGGFQTRSLINDQRFIEWLQTAADCPLKTSVCTGSLLLGAAGFLKAKKATTHQSSFKFLEPFCAEVVDEKVVDAGEVITARGVSSSLDLGLYLCEKLAGREARERIQKQMDYQNSVHQR
ncbi:MAG: DJ-1/PfpI family protein [Acidobacteriota bacterium]